MTNKNLKFDISVDSSSLFSPQNAEFYSKVFINPADVNNFHIIPNNKNSVLVSTSLMDSVLKAHATSFAASTTTLSSTTVSVESLMACVEMSRTALESSFIAHSMAQGANADYSAGAYNDFFFNALAEEINSEIHAQIFKGDKTNTGFTGTNAYLKLVDGLEKKALADATVLDVTATAVTSSNVVTVLEAVVNRLPEAVRLDKAGLVMFVASDVYYAYEMAVLKANTSLYTSQDIAPTFAGIKLVVSPMTSGRVLLGNKKSFIYSFDGAGDQDQIEIIDLKKTTGDDAIRARVNVKVGTEIINGSQVVLMS